MKRPFLSVVIPTIGREPGLANALESVVHQDHAELIEIVVVGDSHGGRELREAQQTSRAYTARWFAHDGGSSCYGQQQRQYGMQQARGRYVAFLADDDIWLPYAFNAIRIAVQAQVAPRPLLFRVKHWLGWPIWDQEIVLPGHVDANCIVAPNDPSKLGQWESTYEGDYSFISGTVKCYGGAVDWRKEVIGICRPNESDIWMHKRRVTA